MPQYAARLSDWDFAPRFSDRYFEFSPPHGIVATRKGARPVGIFQVRLHAPTIFLEEADGTNQFYWTDATGDLRINGSAPTGSSGTPTVADTAGAVVGGQSSPEFLKNILYTYSNDPDDMAYAKFRSVLDTPIKDFTFKNGKHFNQVFTGIAIPDGEHPWYGMDPVQGRKDIAPIGTAKALNELSIPGYLILSIKVLNKKIERLENEISRLQSSRAVAVR